MKKTTNKRIDLTTIQHWLLIPLFCAINHSALATTVPQQEQNAIFQAAKFKRLSGSWVSTCSMGHISDYRDLNKDSRIDAILVDGGKSCYGSVGTGFHVMTKQTNNQWTRIFRSPGRAVMLAVMGGPISELKMTHHVMPFTDGMVVNMPSIVMKKMVKPAIYLKRILRKI